MKKNKKTNSAKVIFTESLNFIKQSRNFIYAIVAIFFIFALIGFFVPASENIKIRILDFIIELVNQTENMTLWELFYFIFFNNLKSCFFAMILGSFLGIIPILVALVNGYLLGFVSALGVMEEGVSSLWRIFPHGIFELPAIFISLGMGLRLGCFIFRKNRLANFKKDLILILRVFALVILPLLLIAAFIESMLIFFTRG